MAKRTLAGWLAALALLATIGCRSSAPYVWADDVPPASTGSDREYLIRQGDTLSVRVYGQDGMSARTRVRPDGRISLPCVDDIEAAGSTPTALARRIQVRLKEFVVNPVVTVSLEDPRPLTVSVLGEVTRPGTFTLDQGVGVLHALAAAGGTTPFADKDAIYVIRRRSDGKNPDRIRFTYQSLTSAQGRASTFSLQGGDVIVVE